MKTCSLRAAAALTAALTTALTPIAASAQATQYEYRKVAKTLVVNGEASPVQPGGEASGGTQGSPVLGVSSLAVDFGNVATNTTEKRQVVVSNDGTGTLSFTGAPTVTGAAEFAAGLTTCGAALAAGADCLAEATFSPTTTGTFNGLLAFTAAAAGSPKEVTLVGTAFNPVSLASATLPTATVGQPYTYDFKTLLAVSNEGSPDKTLATWEAAGNLPAGLALDAATGVLSGTPSAAESGASYTVTGTYKNNQGQQLYTIVVNGVTLQVVQISAGGSHTCAVTTVGGLKCWGNNGNGRLGDGTALNRLTPVDVVGLTSGVASVSAGYNYTCAVTTVGGAKCWGNNGTGQLGDGSTTSRTTPVNVSNLGSGVALISAGRNQTTCAVTTAGGLKCWGRNDSGQVGDGSTTHRSLPVDVTDLSSGVASVSAGGYHTCAVTTSGAAKCWGDNGTSQLGNGVTGTATSRAAPVNVAGLSTGVQSISAGIYHACVVMNSGGVKCWGSNQQGQLGDGTVTTSRMTPVDVQGLSSGTTSVSAGGYHTCAVTTAGNAKCWGSNLQGQLGDGTTTQQTTPTDVSNLSSGVASISVGEYHSCVLTSGGNAKCWGLNGTQGRLGDGTTTQRLTPVDVQP